MLTPFPKLIVVLSEIFHLPSIVHDNNAERLTNDGQIS